MALSFLKMIISLLFALSLFHRMYSRSISTFLVLFIGFAWVVLESIKKGDYGLWIVSSGLIFIYWRAMQKAPLDTIFREEDNDSWD